MPWLRTTLAAAAFALAGSSALAQAAPETAAPAAPPLRVPDTMAQRALACTGCHGPQGRATASGYVPRLAGKPADYLFQQLRHFRDGRRSNPEMAHLLQDID